MNLRDKLKPKASPPPIPPLPAAKPLQRQRRHAVELALGEAKIPVELYQMIHDINSRTVRRFCSTFPRPGLKWGDPDVVAMQIMLGTAIETAVAKALESTTVVTLPADIPRDNSVGPFPDDERTQPMGRLQKPHG